NCEDAPIALVYSGGAPDEPVSNKLHIDRRYDHRFEHSVFVALCIRFVGTDGLVIRAALVFCLCLLIWGKPVHLPMSLLLLTPYRRLGWRRAIAFCAAAMAVAAAPEVWWSYLVRHFFAYARLESLFELGNQEMPGHNAAVQMNFAIAHPILMAKVI